MKSDFRIATKNFFSRPAYFQKGKNQAIEVSEFSRARRFEFETFLDFLEPKKGAKLIELGSGYGRFVLPLLKLGFKVTAVDISAEALSALEREAKKNKLEKKLELLNSDLR